ncbi:DUF4350 domain-containing protein [Lapillicoccus jejuensis]|uniref:Uncharacterized protein DUF4350 n=1 Tax=Lapillicoccus jejuensis TaxID=402171 RepID=A0A542E274_9MICO|nr:DUF4350 domain-containing protein [Lapillicoccus jejuensis]TQJ09437.1 uncharacterized protein DUF4350 [Lapillicoccus jejuensis]
MTLLDPTPDTTEGTAAATADAPARPARRRRLVWVALAVLVVGAAVLMSALSPGAPNQAPLDPDDPGRYGARAVAEVLRRQGVQVDVVRSQDALLAATVDGDTTVLVATTDDLAEATIDRLVEASSTARRLVVVDPPSWVLGHLDPDVQSAALPVAAGDLRTGDACRTPDVRDGEQLAHAQRGYRTAPDSGVEPDAACWVGEQGYATYLALPGDVDRAPLVLLGSSTALDNDEVDEADDAAVVLRTLGATPRLVWYVPTLTDIPADDTSRTQEVVPGWVGPGLALLTVALLGVMLWRGRRLGRLVREPLPAVVRAVETTQSRGRLYRRARDTGRAAAVLREATRRRLAGYLGLPPGAPPDVLVRATAAAVGQPEPDVGHLLAGPPPATDDELLGLATRLATLEREVRRS